MREMEQKVVEELKKIEEILEDSLEETAEILSSESLKKDWQDAVDLVTKAEQKVVEELKEFEEIIEDSLKETVDILSPESLKEDFKDAVDFVTAINEEDAKTPSND